ncbi:helix-turn-helix transcriptional regulator [Diaphorobacter sp. HDW4A]|uniref:helix-turn-helix transcriptional regulator n=1 Tax=Diaphorobacter sp. HDW4A TaxID=2714924 RepID=UPI00140BF959|nr:LuxR C-terminal-related transcriptional regulator [Diaphorobacter sp. HDW4A]QIL82781.1 helix-turn-helix transcriptional regulator [Diaphorobacter sp. HDW4A]
MSQREEHGLVPLIGAVYEASMAPEKWPDFLARFAATFQSEQALMWAHDFSDNSADLIGGPTSIACTVGLDDFYLDGYTRHFCHCNVWLENEHLHHEGHIVNSSRLSPDGKLPSTEWFGDWLRPQDLFYSFAAVVEKRNRRSFNVTALRSKAHGPYTPQEEQQLRTLMPHLQTAFALHRRLHRAEALAQASLGLLDRLPLGIVLLDAKAQVLHANARAHSLAQESGLIRIKGRFLGEETLHATRQADDMRLQATMRRAVSTGLGVPIQAGQGMRLQGLQHNLHLLISPLPQQCEPFGTHAAAAVFISDPTATLHELDAVLRACYGLSMAESLLAQALVNGLSVREYAEERALSVHTVRVQLKSITAKVGVRRQADLIRTILNGPAVLQRSAATHQNSMRPR